MLGNDCPAPLTVSEIVPALPLPGVKDTSVDDIVPTGTAGPLSHLWFPPGPRNASFPPWMPTSIPECASGFSGPAVLHLQEHCDTMPMLALLDGEILDAIVKPFATMPLSRKSMLIASLPLSGSVWVDSHCHVHDDDDDDDDDDDEEAAEADEEGDVAVGRNKEATARASGKCQPGTALPLAQPGCGLGIRPRQRAIGPKLTAATLSLAITASREAGKQGSLTAAHSAAALGMAPARNFRPHARQAKQPVLRRAACARADACACFTSPSASWCRLPGSTGGRDPFNTRGAGKVESERKVTG